MAKKDKLLKAFQDNLGKWVCGYCNSGSNQPAATFREIEKLGYEFEEHSPNRWGKEIYCDRCNENRTHYKLIRRQPVFSEKPRINISSEERIRIIKLLGGKDAFTDGTISSTPEIDHKVPWTRLEADIDASKLNDDEIQKHFQLLTREHNLLKDRACGSCKKTNIRPPFFEVEYWYDGNSNYRGSCIGCGWYDGIAWRKALNRFINSQLKPFGLLNHSHY